MVLDKIAEIYKNIDSSIRKFIYEIRIRSADAAIILYVPRNKVSTYAKQGFTSEQQLTNLKIKLRSIYNREIEHILIEPEVDINLEEAVRTILNIAFPEDIISFHMSINENRVGSCWVETTSSDAEVQQRMHDKLANILEGTGVKLDSVHWSNVGHELPSLPSLLRLLKVIQPASLDEITRRLSLTYSSVNQSWANNKLDQLRKKKLLLRDSSERYVLTTSGLSAVPSGINRNSSDIARALELGSKRWNNR